MAAIQAEKIILNGENVTLSGSKIYINGILYADPSISSTGLVSLTDNQTISGSKTFAGNGITSFKNTNNTFNLFEVNPVNGVVTIRLSNGLVAFQTDEIALYDGAGTPSVFFGDRLLKLGSYETTVDWGNGLLLPPSGNASVNWMSRLLAYTNGDQAVDWGTGRLFAGGDSLSADWITRGLYSSGASLSLNWQNKQLSGNWETNTIPTSDWHIVNKGYVDSLFTSPETIDGGDIG